MTDKPALFQGTYADFKVIKTRKVAQIVVEVPIEAANDALEALGGVPRSDKEVWLAVARLDLKPVQAPPERPKRPYSYTQQAAIRCNEPVFHAFLNEVKGYDVGEKEHAATAVKHLCEVKSRADFDKDEEAGQRWRALESEYAAWLLTQ